jgi:hypothetical protein
MAGKGGYKHRARALKNKQTQRLMKARESIRRVRHKYESKGQPWDPLNNPTQMAELTHAARQLIQQTSYARF